MTKKTNKLFMAFASGSESTEESNIKRYIGIAPVSVLADMDTSSVQIVTGENYQTRGNLLERDDVITINIFNISKFVSKGDSTRMRRISEYLGESYFDFLTNTKDLVVLMDESHRYRASTSSNALNDLKPLV